MAQLLQLFSWKSGFPGVDYLSLSLFLPLPPSPFQAEFPFVVWRLAGSTYLPWLLKHTQEGAKGGTPFAIQTGDSGLTQMV